MDGIVLIAYLFACYALSIIVVMYRIQFDCYFDGINDNAEHLINGLIFIFSPLWIPISIILLLVFGILALPGFVIKKIFDKIAG